MVVSEYFCIFADKFIFLNKIIIMNDNKVMNRAADNIRILAASMVEKAKSGHPGGAMGGADFINTLYSEFLVYDPEFLPRSWSHGSYAV